MAPDRPDRIDAWLAAATADATRRDLPALVPLLEALALSTRALRHADAGHPAAASAEPDRPVRPSHGT